MKPRKNIVKRIFDVILSAFILILAIFIALSIYCKKTGKQVFSYSVLWVLTDSMEYEIPARSYILVKKVDPKTVQVGDVISFYSSDPLLTGSLNTHRVKEIIGDHEEFVTRGDNNLADDRYTAKAENVVFIYVRNLELMTFFGRLFSTQAGLSVVLVTILAGMIIFCTYLQKDTKKKAEASSKEAEIERLIQEEVARLEKENIKERINKEVARLEQEHKDTPDDKEK